MDENSRKGETVERPVDGQNSSKLENVSQPYKSPNLGIRFEIRRIGANENTGSSHDSSGPSYADSPPPTYENNQTSPIEVRQGVTDGKVVTPFKVTTFDLPKEHPGVRISPNTEEPPRTRRNSIGPPPSYSFVMKQKRKSSKVSPCEPILSSRAPPPTYGGMPRLFVSPDEDRICNLQPIWRSHSQPALCPRCGIIVLTTTHSHDSLATHLAVLTLCLFGCWPCCLLPYCMNVCKNTYHHCPICQTFLGVYTPW